MFRQRFQNVKLERRSRRRLRGNLRLAANDQRIQLANARNKLVFLKTSGSLDLEMRTLREKSDAFGGNAVSCMSIRASATNDLVVECPAT